jgi:hypothetical protein
MPSRLEVLSIEPQSGIVRVGLDMRATRPPESRLFVLTDDRGRRFVPAIAECTTADAIPEASAHGAAAESPPQIHWQCELTVAPLYRRAPLTGVAMEYGDRIVSALPGQVRARWAEGPTATPTPPPARSPAAGTEAAPSPAPAPLPAPPSAHEPEPPSASGEDDEETEPE